MTRTLLLLLLTIFLTGCINTLCQSSVVMLGNSAAFCDSGATVELSIVAGQPIAVCRCKEVKK